MSILSKIWENTIGKIAEQFERPDPNSCYIAYSTLEQAVKPMPNPLNIQKGHEETAYKWAKMSHWVSATITPTNSEKATFGQMGGNLFSVSRAIQSQKDGQTIKIPKDDWENFQKNISFLLETVTFYDRKPLDDPKVSFLRSVDRNVVPGTNIPIPGHDKNYPDKPAHIRHFYKTIIEDMAAPSHSAKGRHLER